MRGNFAHDLLEENWLFNGPYSRWYTAAVLVPLLYLGFFFLPWPQLGRGCRCVAVAAQLRPERRRGHVIR